MSLQSQGLYDGLIWIAGVGKSTYSSLIPIEIHGSYLTVHFLFNRNSIQVVTGGRGVGVDGVGGGCREGVMLKKEEGTEENPLLSTDHSFITSAFHHWKRASLQVHSHLLRPN